MKIVPVYEAKNRFSELLVAAEQGEIVSITRRRTAVARLIAEPVATQGKAEARRRIAASLSRLRGWRDEVQLKGDIKALSREGDPTTKQTKHDKGQSDKATKKKQI